MPMDNKATSSLFGFYNSSDASMNVPVHSGPGLSQISPYLNVDPSVLQSQPEFLTLEGASQTRGRLELSFSQIGGMCMSGAAVGGVQGLYRGFLETKAAGHSGKIRRTQLINYVTKRGNSLANTLGVVAVMYSGIGCIMYYARDKKEDSINTIGAGTITGLLYKSTSGLRKCAIGGGIGLIISSLYVAFTARDKFKDDYSYRY